MNCAALGMNWKASAKNHLATASPSLAPSSAENTFIPASVRCCSPVRTQDKENSGGMETNKSWLSKVCSKLRGHKQRLEKCEKCGQRSDTCRPNPSFISGRKHYLCQDCRVSSHNMKNMYHQLCRNLSLREHSRTTTCDSGDLSSSPKSSRGGGLSRSKSMKVQPTSPESGYETATSLDSSSSDRMSAVGGVSTSSGECGRCCSPELSTLWSPAAATHHLGDHDQNSADNHVCSRTEVFGGAFKSEKAHLHQLQQLRTYTRQSPALPQQNTTTTTKSAHKPHLKDTTAATKQYDGYLEIRTPNSSSVKYVFKKPESGEVSGQSAELHRDQKAKHSENLKQCYRCHKQRSVAFRAPFGNGWLCEDCMDDLM